MDVDVAIIGGGLAGAATFAALAERGADCVLVEEASELATGASFANGAMLTPSMADPWNGPGVWKDLLFSLAGRHSAIRLHPSELPRLGRWGWSFLRHSAPTPHWAATRANHALAMLSMAQTRDWAERFGLEVGESPRGTMKVFEDARAMARPLALAERLAHEGLDFGVLDAAGAVALEPALAPVAGNIAGAIHYPNDGVGDARDFARSLGAAGRQAGGAIRLGARVRDIAATGRGWRIEDDEGVTTARRVVLAAGVATPALAARLGIRLPIRPVKGYSLTIPIGSRAGAPAMAVIDDARHISAAPLGGHLRVAGTAALAGHDWRADPRGLARLGAAARRLYPALLGDLDPQAANGWAGLRPVSADGRPFIGESARPGLWVNAGHGHLGWTLAAGSATLLARLMAGEAPGIDPAPFALVGRTGA